ncbi:MAG: nucleotide-binding universal stress UspA family protein [Bradymonadia bacterium]|jgi:nucleotide-binding universal stress UspA family protein
MSELPTVVAAVADSETAARTFEIAKTLADTASGGRLFAVHATGEIPPAMAEVLFPYACFGEDEDLLRAELVRTAHTRVSARLKDGSEEKIGEQLKVVAGDPATAIPEALSGIDSDLLVVGAGSKVGATWPTLGTTGHLLRASHAPVLVVRCTATAPRQLQKILVGVDLSPDTLQVLAVALEWAQRTGGQVQPLYVVPDAAGLDHAELLEPRGNVGRLKKAVTARWTQIEAELDPRYPIAENLKALLRPRIITSGEPGHKLVELAIEAETDLVIVGRSRSNGGIAGALGRVAEYVVRHAPCHVMVVPGVAADD